MKNKPALKRALQSIVAMYSLVVILHAAPLPESPEQIAKQNVITNVYEKISPRSESERPFSRVMPVRSHFLSFQPERLVKNEARLPFSIIPANRGKEGATGTLMGYVRLSDQEIFIYDLKEKTYLPMAEHPLFATERLP